MASKDQLCDIAFRAPESIFNLPTPESVAERYQSAYPFPHLIIDDFFSTDIAKEITSELTNTQTNFSVQFNDDFQKQKMISTGNAVPKCISLLATKFASAEMLEYLEKVTGIEGLIPDPYYNTKYGYYHVMGPGGVLGSHVDHSYHQTLNVPHVLNIVVYLTENWDEIHGGALSLFNANGKKVVSKIPCAFNRAAVFSANPISWHGVEPIKEAATKKRYSIYFAYYSVKINQQNQEVETFPGIHSKDRSNETAKFGTYFIVPWYKLLTSRNRLHLRIRINNLARMILPPFVVMFLRKVKSAIH